MSTTITEYKRHNGTVRTHIRNGLPATHASYGKGMVEPSEYHSGSTFITFVVGGSGTHAGKTFKVSKRTLEV